MKKILLTNIGNRNIVYQGSMYSAEIGNAKKEITFREWSKDLLNRYDEVKNDLDINIINPLVTSEPKPEEIILYYSDQREYDTRTDQDTIYEAQLIKKILIDKYQYPESAISTVHVESKVIDNGGLIRFYRKNFVYLKRKSGDNKIILCDAGGTAQQKTSSKIMAEFIFEKNQYEVKYVERNASITDVNIDEYRGVINTEQAIQLIHHGQYTAANQLLGYDTIWLFHLSNDWQKKVHAHIYFRFIGNEKLAKLNINGLKKVQDIHLKKFRQMELDFDSKGMDNLIHKDNIYRITDYLHKAEFLFNIGQISSSVMAFSQFYEYLFEQYLIKSYGKKKLQKANQTIERRNDFEKWILKNIPKEIDICRKRYEDKSIGKLYKIIPSSLALRCMIAKNSTNEIISEIALKLSPYIDFTDDADKTSGYINRLRNKVAHDGLYLTKSDLEYGGKALFYTKLLKEIISIFGFKNGNPFIHLNSLIEKNLRQ